MAKATPSKETSAEVQKYLGIIKAYETEYAQWEKRVSKITKRYRSENTLQNRDNPPTHFPIFWSNVQTLIPAVFARLPQPDVSRRFSDRDPVGRVSALILERALDFEIQHYPDYKATMKECVSDRFLGGRGTAWARYEPHMKAGAIQQPPDGAQVSEDENEPEETLEYECAPVDYVHYKDFGHQVARTWEEVTCVWRKVYMTRAACVERFGAKVGEKIPLDASPEELKRSDRENAELSEQKRACVIELWDKTKKEAVWLSKSMKELLDKKADPLELEEFFPCPRPLYATLTNDSLIPVPDFALYQDQANSLDILADRIDGLVKALQVKGVYDASLGPEIARLFTDADNTDLRPVKAWQAFAEKNGLAGCMDLVDLTPIAKALESAYIAFDQEKNQIYDITGIADIIRGQSKASETATAQQIKGQYAGLRLRDMQHGVALFATDLLRLKAQIVCGFDPQTLIAISAAEQLSPEDQKFIPQAIELLRDRPLRNFRVDITADSLVQIDEKEEKESTVEFLQATTTFFQGTAEVAAAAPELLPLFIELYKFGARRFKVGKQVEGQLDQALEALKAKAQQPQQMPPEAQAEQMRAQADMQKAQLDVQVAQAKAGIQMQEMQGKQQMQRQQMAIDQQKQQQDMAFQQQKGAMQQQQAQAQHQQKMQAAMMPPAPRRKQ